MPRLPKRTSEQKEALKLAKATKRKQARIETIKNNLKKLN